MILKVASVAVLVFLVLWGRVFYGSMQDYKTAETFLKENQTIRAITYFDRSLHWYAPLNPYVERSAKRLWEIGERAEQEKDPRMALIAYESIRNGFYGASHVFRPGKDWIQRAESKIQDPQPDVGWSVVVVIGFLGWVGSLLGLILVLFRQGEVRGSKGIFWFGFSFLCFILWLVGMTKA
ncbi:MAG: hypothetical protein MUC98_17105 [Desulfobacterota bacterium]|nr:hypothetical protein [Thermodesulfobacteriota bacterium]